MRFFYGDNLMMKITVNEDVHSPVRSDNVLLARLDMKPGYLSAGIMETKTHRNDGSVISQTLPVRIANIT